MFHARVSSTVLIDRLNAEANSPEFLESASTMKDSGLPLRRLGEIVTAPINNSIRDVSAAYRSNTAAVPLFRPVDIQGVWLETADAMRVSRDFEELHKKARVRPGNIVVAVAGTVGRAARVPSGIDYAAINGSCARIVVPTVSDGYLLTYLNTRYGYLSMMRWSVGSVQKHLNLEDMPAVTVPWPTEDVQRYIGDKVRQAERLRQISRERSTYALRLVNAFLADSESAVNLEHAISMLLNGQVLADEYSQHIESKNARQPNQGRKSSRIPKKFLTTRLDCNFYNRDALELDMRFAKGYEIATLGDVVDQSRQITNGVRGPDIRPSMFKLVRLQDFAGWSIDFDSCLTISEAQFRENRRCRLQEEDIVVAIGGYIGHAAMARRVQTAVIGQHSAMLPMGTNSKVDAGFLVAFLSSNAGAIQLQRYVSGTVQVGVNLEDLRQVRLPLPSSVLQKHIGDAIRQADNCSHWASRLLNTACRLVESLIEGRITENELCEAYVAFNEGDRQADSSILERMTVGGLDMPHESPLFPDLDGLYAAIDEAERAYTDGQAS